MNLKFNLNRPPVSDEEINKHKDFDKLVKQFKEQSLKKAQSDETWWKNKKIRYSAVISGITVICTVTYLSLVQNKSVKTKHETLTTHPSKNKNQSSFISPPSDKLAGKKTVYRVNASSGAHLTHSSSTQIRVPKNALVNKEGKIISGEVTIEYREMQDIADAMLNGIPMAYDSAGKKYNLETAGMFDIRGFQNGEPVFIRPGETIEVKLASSTSEDRFNQYYLDTLAKNWLYLKKDELNTHSVAAKPQTTQNKNNTELQNLKAQIETVLPRKIDSVKTRYTDQVQKLPQPALPRKPKKANGERPVFVIDASTKDYPEMGAYENTVFEVGDENTNYTKELHEITWSDVRILPGPSKGKNYLLRLSYRNRTEELIVYPVVKAGDFDKAMLQYQKQYAAYELKLQQRQNQEQRLMDEMKAKQQQYLTEQQKKKEEYEKELARQIREEREQSVRQLNADMASAGNAAKAERIFRISQFGIFNSDCPHPVPVENSIKPVFMLEGNARLVVPERVYLIDHASKTVTGYASSDFSLNFDNETPYSICLFRQGKMFLCNKESFIKSVEQKKKEFLVKALPEKQDELTDIKRFLEL